jgi:hypothetical protein
MIRVVPSTETRDPTPRERFDDDPWHKSQDPQPWFGSDHQTGGKRNKRQKSLHMERHDVSSQDSTPGLSGHQSGDGLMLLQQFLLRLSDFRFTGASQL